MPHSNHAITAAHPVMLFTEVDVLRRLFVAIRGGHNGNRAVDSAPFNALSTQVGPGAMAFPASRLC